MAGARELGGNESAWEGPSLPDAPQTATHCCARRPRSPTWRSGGCSRRQPECRACGPFPVDGKVAAMAWTDTRLPVPTADTSCGRGASAHVGHEAAVPLGDKGTRRPRSRREACSEPRARDVRSETETWRSRVRPGALPTPAGLCRHPRSGAVRARSAAVRSLVIRGAPAACRRARLRDREDEKGQSPAGPVGGTKPVLRHGGSWCVRCLQGPRVVAA